MINQVFEFNKPRFYDARRQEAATFIIQIQFNVTALVQFIRKSGVIIRINVCAINVDNIAD